MKVTQKDIARKLGVSTSLVSRVLSGRAEEIGIRQELIKEVQALAKKLNYVPSSAALSLKGKKSATVGVVVYDFYDPFFTKVIGALQNVAHEENFSILLVGFMNRAVSEASLRPLYKHSVDGIIIVGSYGDLSWLDNFPGIPAARIGHGRDERLGLCASVDETAAMLSISAHLASQRVSSAVFARRNTPVHAQRETAFLNAFSAGKFKSAFARNSRLATDFEAGREIADKLFEETVPEAVVCASDPIAMGVITRLFERGVSVPGDVLVTGFDDIAAASYFMPAVTSYRQPIDLASRKAFFAAAKGQGLGNFDCEGEVVVRASSIRQKGR